MKLDSTDLATTADDAHPAPKARGNGMTAIDLRKYTRPRFLNEKRYGLEAPFNRGDYTIATDGHILVRVAKCLPDLTPDEAAARVVLPPNTAAVEARIKLTDLWPLPWVALRAPETCWQCKGVGRLTDCHCDQHVSCNACGDTGYRPAHEDAVVTPESQDARESCCCHVCFGSKRAWAEGSRVALTTACSIAPRYYALLAELPGIRVDPTFDSRDIHGVGGGLSFAFDGGDGMLMPLRFDGLEPGAPMFYLKQKVPVASVLGSVHVAGVAP